MRNGKWDSFPISHFPLHISHGLMFFSSLSDIVTAFNTSRGLPPPPPPSGRGRFPCHRGRDREEVDPEVDMMATCKEKVTISH